jgi:hypothetical protein
MYRELLGFLDCLLHVEMLLLGSISREDSELVELDAVVKRPQQEIQLIHVL